ncbi:hypothetical protein BGX29_008180 [Mortierella sp. GBA35]|nr:hypothetical protein BGX29_008180 [Mortierella sp. GBA35]
MPDVTAGSYLGSRAIDPNAEIRKIFSEPGNHQDGLGTILKYCQEQSGFTVGSSDVTSFIQQLQGFSGVVHSKTMIGTQPMGAQAQVVEKVKEFLDVLPDKTKIDKFNLSLHGNFSSTLVHFCIDLQGDSLYLYITKLIMQGVFDYVLSVCSFEVWEVNRQEMTRRADELATKTKLKNRIDEWTKQISSVTAGSYLGSQADDPNAELRKIFSEWGNQQDGLGTILSYCQTESGYTAGSTDITGFLQQLQGFSGVIDRKSFTTISPMGLWAQVIEQINQFLLPHPDMSKIKSFLGSPLGISSSTLVHFCVELKGDSLRLFIPKIFVQGFDWILVTSYCTFEMWEVNRQEMTKRADELVSRTQLKNRIDDWTKNITSD